MGRSIELTSVTINTMKNLLMQFAPPAMIQI